MKGIAAVGPGWWMSRMGPGCPDLTVRVDQCAPLPCVLFLSITNGLSAPTSGNLAITDASRLSAAMSPGTRSWTLRLPKALVMVRISCAIEPREVHGSSEASSTTSRLEVRFCVVIPTGDTFPVWHCVQYQPDP